MVTGILQEHTFELTFALALSETMLLVAFVRATLQALRVAAVCLDALLHTQGWLNIIDRRCTLPMPGYPRLFQI